MKRNVVSTLYYIWIILDELQWGIAFLFLYPKLSTSVLDAAMEEREIKERIIKQ